MAVNKEKNLSITMLMDFYGQLLTDKQLAALDMYYNEDLSLAEIALEEGISRQGVRDNIKRGEKILVEYENKLGLAQRFTKINFGLERMRDVIDTLKTEGNEESIAELKRLANEMTLEL